MGPLALAGIGAGLGFLKSQTVDKKREKDERNQAATTARWSPWTGMAPNEIHRADPFGSAMQGGMAGAMMGQMAGGGGAETVPGGVAGADVGAGGVPMAQGSQFYQPYQAQAPNAQQDYTSPWMGMKR